MSILPAEMGRAPAPPPAALTRSQSVVSVLGRAPAPPPTTTSSGRRTPASKITATATGAVSASSATDRSLTARAMLSPRRARPGEGYSHGTMPRSHQQHKATPLPQPPQKHAVSPGDLATALSQSNRVEDLRSPGDSGGTASSHSPESDELASRKTAGSGRRFFSSFTFNKKSSSSNVDGTDAAPSSSSYSSVVSSATSSSNSTTTSSSAPSADVADPSKSSKTEALYEKYLEMAHGQTFEDIRNLQMIYRCGVDDEGRPIIVFIGARVPSKDIDLERFLLYMIQFMDPMVENKFILIFVNSQVKAANRPPLNFLQRANNIFNRKYKKNLSALYIVHPTFWVKCTLRLCRPFVSSKFWRKVTYVSHIEDLYKYVPKEQVFFPDAVLKFRERKRKCRPIFGMPLSAAIKQNLENEASGLPLIVEKALAFVNKPSVIIVEGIFRKSGKQSEVDELRKAFDRGDDVNLETISDPHSVAGLLKLYFRELPDPVFPQWMYASIIDAQNTFGEGDVNVKEWTATMDKLLAELPPENVFVLQTLLDTCRRVVAKSDTNLMTPNNLAIVLAPNLLRTNHDDPLKAMKDTAVVNRFFELLIWHPLSVLEQ